MTGYRRLSLVAAAVFAAFLAFGSAPAPAASEYAPLPERPAKPKPKRVKPAEPAPKAETPAPVVAAPAEPASAPAAVEVKEPASPAPAEQPQAAPAQKAAESEPAKETAKEIAKEKEEKATEEKAKEKEHAKELAKEKEEKKKKAAERKEKQKERAEKEPPAPKQKKVEWRYASKLPADDKGPRAIEFISKCLDNYDKCIAYVNERAEKIPEGDVCLQSASDQQEVTEKVRKFITLRPAMHGEAANRVVTEALYVIYPCRRGTERTAGKKK
ncbi:MAG TPA: hypothetical protein VHD34_08350 [Xanthobacteraceae bacterium]|nr:hypothetical protein [Xanthobacteraceae bacterium]